MGHRISKMRHQLVVGLAALVAASPAAAEVADKEPSVTGLWVWAVGFNVAALALEALRPRFGLLVLPVAGLVSWAGYSELSDPYVGPAILQELGSGYVRASYAAYVAAIVGPLMVTVLSAIVRRRRA